jgi:serine/threonine protein kinase
MFFSSIHPMDGPTVIPSPYDGFKGMYCTVPIAVKVLTDNSDTSARALERELRILMAVEKLPGVVRIHGGNASLENGQPLYVAMERAQGSLYGALHEGSPSVDWSLLSKLEIISSIANAITALSDAGIVHGNLKVPTVLCFL